MHNNSWVSETLQSDLSASHVVGDLSSHQATGFLKFISDPPVPSPPLHASTPAKNWPCRFRARDSKQVGTPKHRQPIAVATVLTETSNSNTGSNKTDNLAAKGIAAVFILTPSPQLSSQSLLPSALNRSRSGSGRVSLSLSLSVSFFRGTLGRTPLPHLTIYPSSLPSIYSFRYLRSQPAG